MNEIETPIWIKYAGDLFFLICFLVVFFLVKPQPLITEDDEADQPNPLEKILKTDEEPSENVDDLETPGEK